MHNLQTQINNYLDYCQNQKRLDSYRNIAC